MLVLSRYSLEEIVIRFGEREVTVKICDIVAGKKVRLGFEAPDDVAIFRKELGGVAFDRKVKSRSK